MPVPEESHLFFERAWGIEHAFEPPLFEPLDWFAVNPLFRTSFDPPSFELVLAVSVTRSPQSTSTLCPTILSTARASASEPVAPLVGLNSSTLPLSKTIFLTPLKGLQHVGSLESSRGLEWLGVGVAPCWPAVDLLGVARCWPAEDVLGLGGLGWLGSIVSFVA